jgi:hypothetical protein
MKALREHDFDKASAERYNVKMTGLENVERLSVSRMIEETGDGECYNNRRVGRTMAHGRTLCKTSQLEISEVAHGEETGQLQVGKMACGALERAE